jgi:pyruvate dehydrogenase E2 component (dihydrolipoamide acetyltransferase)
LGQLLEICVPDIGDFDEVEVVEILVAKGDQVSFEDPLVSIESDKATMEIPSTAMGMVVELRVTVGDRVSEGSVLVVLETVADTKDQPETGDAARSEHPESVVAPPSVATETISAPETYETTETTRIEPVIAGRELSRAAANPVPDRAGLPHASPLVRRYARELGVPLTMTDGSGNHGRVLVDDLKRHVRERFASDVTNGGSPASGIPAMPPVDHASFGPIREEKLTRIQKVSGPVLRRSWLNVPHVTQHDEADVTLLERFRRDRRDAAAERGLKLSPLLFVMKAVVIALKEYPTLRSSLSSNQDHLVIKEYFHLGIAVDTDQGLVVPVIRDVDRKGIFELAAEVSATAERARKRKLGPDDLRGACFTISSLGGIGGTAFTPIVNAPEVAILGLSKTRVQPLWQGPSPLDLMESTAGVRGTKTTQSSTAVDPAGGADPPPSGHFVPRLVLPLSLSYDHRVIDGALAARFTSRLSRLLSNPMQQLL